MAIYTREWGLEDLDGKKLWVPHMCDSSFVLAALFRNLGFDADILPRSPDLSFSMGRKQVAKYGGCDQCLPSIITTEDILQRVFSQDFKPDKEAFFQGKSEGPCRFGRYYMMQQLALQDLGFSQVPIVTLDSRNAYRGFGPEAKILAWDGMVAQSFLERAVHFISPFEKRKGEAEKVYQKSLKEVCDYVEGGIPGNFRTIKIGLNRHKHQLTEILEQAVNDFSSISVDTPSEPWPVAWLTGEIFVRSDDRANKGLAKNLIKLGIIPYIEPTSGFFDFVNENKYREARARFKFNLPSIRRLRATWIDRTVTRRDERDMAHIFEPILGEYAHDPSAPEVIADGSYFIDPSHKTEAIVTLGSSYHLARTGKIHGVANAYPWGCMPSFLVDSKTKELIEKVKEETGNKYRLPFINLPYDGHSDHSMHLAVFAHRVHKYQKRMSASP